MTPTHLIVPAFVPKALSTLGCDWTNIWLDKHVAGLRSLLKEWYNANSGTSDLFLPEDWPLATHN